MVGRIAISDTILPKPLTLEKWKSILEEGLASLFPIMNHQKRQVSMVGHLAGVILGKQVLPEAAGMITHDQHVGFMPLAELADTFFYMAVEFAV